MAKKPEGIDDIAKAIMAAIKAARSQASRTSQDVGYQVKRAKVLSNKEVRKSLKTVDGYQKEMWKDMAGLRLSAIASRAYLILASLANSYRTPPKVFLVIS